MENTIDLKKNSPQSGDDDKHSAQNPKITPASEGKGKGPVAAADDKKEAPPADATVPAAERAEKGNAGGGQKAGRKRARGAAAGEGSAGRDNQGGGGAGGYQLPVEEPMKLTTCPWEGCSSVFDNRRALFLHVSVHVRRPWLKSPSSSSSTTPVPRQERKAEKEVEGGKAAPPDGDKPAAVAGGAATDEARKAKQAEIDLNLRQFLVPDLNLHPQEAEDQEAISHG